MFRPVFFHWMRFYRWLRFRRGFGVHSPYAFSLINDVIGEKYFYYAYQDVYSHVNRLCAYCFRGDSRRREYHRFLFRLSNFKKPSQILSIGSDGGVDLLFLMAPDKRIRGTLVDYVPKNMDTAFRLCEENRNFTLVESHFDLFVVNLEELLKSKTDFQLIVIHRSLSPFLKQKAVELCLLYQNEDCLIVVDGIYSSSADTQNWKSFQINPKVTVSFDLISCGLFSINNKLKKKNYKYYM